MRKFNLIIVVGLFLSACATSSSVDVSKTTFGAMTGYTKITKKKQLMKIGIRPVSPKEDPIYTKQLFNHLKIELEASDFLINKAGTDIVLMIPSHSILKNDLTVLDNIKPILNKLADILDDYPKTFIEVTGHTSSVGNRNDNQRISIVRAQTIVETILKEGIEPERFYINGMGESRWIAPNNTHEGRALNNRIEIRVSPILF